MNSTLPPHFTRNTPRLFDSPAHLQDSQAAAGVAGVDEDNDQGRVEELSQGELAGDGGGVVRQRHVPLELGELGHDARQERVDDHHRQHLPRDDGFVRNTWRREASCFQSHGQNACR